LSQNVGLRFGYSYREADYSAGAQQSIERNFDVGFGFQRPLSKLRKTTFGFNLGSSAIDGPVRGGSSASNERQYQILGDAALTHQLGRTWRLQASYRRGLGLIEGLGGPVFTNGFTFNADGFLNRRIDVEALVGYSTGESTLARGDSQFTTYTGDVRVRFAVTRMWAAYAQYLYYFYDFSHGLLLPPGIAPSLQRNGVRAGFTLLIPLRRR
jgi:hypothetical protein